MTGYAETYRRSIERPEELSAEAAERSRNPIGDNGTKLAGLLSRPVS